MIQEERKRDYMMIICKLGSSKRELEHEGGEGQ